MELVRTRFSRIAQRRALVSIQLTTQSEIGRPTTIACALLNPEEY